MTINKQELSITFTGSNPRDHISEAEAIRTASFIWGCSPKDLTASKTTRKNEVVVTRKP